jgi:hypothetical protein
MVSGIVAHVPARGAGSRERDRGGRRPNPGGDIAQRHALRLTAPRVGVLRSRTRVQDWKSRLLRRVLSTGLDPTGNVPKASDHDGCQQATSSDLADAGGV